jgi:DNA-binding NarL/FixJ family response regulator
VTNNAEPITVVIVDDQPVIRQGFTAFLSYADDIAVVAEAADGDAAIEQIARHAPDIALMDIRMPRMDGLTATRHIVTSHPRTRVIILTTFDLDEYVFEALRSGASGFLLKDLQASELAHAVRTVHGGAALLAPQVTRRVIASFVDGGAPPVPTDTTTLSSLTGREREVLALLARGRSNAEIASDLYISETTAKTHVSNVLNKLSLRDRVQAVVLAYESGFIRTS